MTLNAITTADARCLCGTASCYAQMGQICHETFNIFNEFDVSKVWKTLQVTVYYSTITLTSIFTERIYTMSFIYMYRLCMCA